MQIKGVIGLAESKLVLSGLSMQFEYELQRVGNDTVCHYASHQAADKQKAYKKFFLHHTLLFRFGK